MADLPWVREFTGRLTAAGIVYMVTGSVAAMVRGEPRFTHDVDLVMKLSPEQIGDLQQAFPEPRFYLPPRDIIQTAIRADRGQFNIIDSDNGFKADCYLVAADPLHLWAMDRREMFEIEGSTIAFAPLEYVIIR